jgi:predicted HTH domain antitoxin
MRQLTIELPDEALAALALAPDEVTREASRILAIHWYAEGRISQGTGAAIAGLSRSEFIEALAAAKVPAIQATAEELREEMMDGVGAHRQRQPTDPAWQNSPPGAALCW